MTPRPAVVRVAVVQAGAVPFDAAGCVAKAIRLLAESESLELKRTVSLEALKVGDTP